ncbi:DRS7C reductase, partial [Panurus biarmicus]|nr:DRS7C reductase [Panurus biarmicus]
MGIFSVLALPLLLLGISGVIYIYQSVRWLLSKSAVQNKVVVITDAISGLGKECSRVFHAGGARLVLCGRTWEKLEALYDALISVTDPSMVADKVCFCRNHTNLSSICATLAKQAIPAFHLSPCICSSSIKTLNPSLLSAKVLPRRNMTSTAILPNMISRRTGHIVLINSIQGKIGIPFRAAYAASKHAAVGFFDCLRAEMEEFDISVSTVSPTFICSYHRQPAPGNWEASIWKFFFRKVSYGVHPVEVAEEVLATVSRKKQEVLMANPIPRAAVYIRTFFPELFFAVVASGIREKLKTEEEN